MFSSKELGDCNSRTQRNAPPTSTNAGYAHGCHHTSLLVLATTRRHAICDLARDTCSPTEDHALSLLVYSVRAQHVDTAVSASSGPPQDLRGLPACYSLTSRTFVHTATHPLVRQSLRPLVRQSLRPLVRRSLHPSHQSSSTDATLSYPQATRQPLQDHRGNSLYTVHLLSQVPADFVMHHHPSSLSLAGEYCRGTRDPSINMTHHTLTSCIS